MSTSKKPVPFTLKGVTTDYFSFRRVSKPELKPTFGYRLAFRAAADRRMVGVSMSIKLSQEKEELVVLRVTCHFELGIAFWNSLREEGNQRFLPRDYALHFATIAAGTTRGVLHAKTENTPYNRYVLTTVNLMQTIKEDVAIKISG